MADKDEPKWWTDVQSAAEDSVAFWNDFLGLRHGAKNDQTLGSAEVAKIELIVRAVSWVESRHGHGSGASAVVDPVQCGNPADAWWKTLTNQLGKGDRFVRGPGLTNLDARDLPTEAAKDAGFPAAAKLSSLKKTTDGHKDANFQEVMSFFWGIPYLIHRTNTKAGDRTFQCGDLSDARLINGAVEYNGGGIKDYRKRIEDALALIDKPVTIRLEAESIDAAHAATAAAERLFARLMSTVREEGGTGVGKLEVFPHGLTSIEFKIEVGVFKAELTLTGPSAKSPEASKRNG
jgi:hypothetical protein